MADDRRFLDISLEFIDEYQLPSQSFQGTTVGGLSAIAYDKKQNRFYALSDDRSSKGAARFYTLNLDINPSSTEKITLDQVTIEAVTFLQNSQGKTYTPNTIDPEGIAISPRDTLFISTEGVNAKNINPFIGEFDPKTGEYLSQLRLPNRFLLNASDESPKGLRENLGFEALDIAATSILKDDPFRLFVATEFSLSQDIKINSEGQSPIRWLHYVISPIGDPVLVAEHLYLLEPAPTGTISNGLTELVALPKEGYWLSLERTFGLFGNGAKIFQVVTGNASDTSRMLEFTGDLEGIKPLQKQLLLDLSTLDIDLDNLEGMTLGPRLPDGSQSLILVSDDNFNKEQVTQFLLFRLQ
ncbi:MAG: esterase-like activity of phytase family protein [Microcystaceae cyanobacterium]